MFVAKQKFCLFENVEIPEPYPLQKPTCELYLFIRAKGAGLNMAVVSSVLEQPKCMRISAFINTIHTVSVSSEDRNLYPFVCLGR